MSGLAALLAQRQPPGVYRWSARSSAAAVRHTVEHVGWRFVHLDTWTVDDERGFLGAVAQAFDLRGQAADGWDALADALRDVTAGSDAAGTVAIWDGWSPLARAEPDAFAAAVDTFDRRVEQARGGAFAVLLRGDGPSIDVPELDRRHPAPPTR